MNAATPPVDPRVTAGMRRQLEAWRERLEGGARRVGWKIGLNPPPVLERLGLDRPVAGHLTTATLLEPGATHSLAGATNPLVEPEVAVEVGDDGAISALALALEVVDIDRPVEDVEAIVGANVFHRAVTIAPPTHGSLAGEGTLLLNGAVVHRFVPEQAAGDLDQAVSAISDTLETCGERLVPGDWIITGAMTQPVAVGPEDTVALDLGPLGRIELRFAA